MTTKSDLRRSLRQMLTDASAWPDSQLDEWCRQAIYEYSLHFPYPRTASWDTSAGVRAYTIYSEAATTIIHAILSVEYPVGDEPPTLLARKREHEADFFGGQYYDLRLDGYSQVLVLGQPPQGGEAIKITYESEHVYPSQEDSNLTVPDKHIELLRLFVQWKAVSYLELAEAVDISRQVSLLKDLGTNSQRAEQAYRARMRQLLEATAPGAWVAAWTTGTNCRIY